MADKLEVYETICNGRFESLNKQIDKVDADAKGRHGEIMGVVNKINTGLFTGNGHESVVVRLARLEERQPTTRGQRVTVASAAGIGGLGAIAWLANLIRELIANGGSP